MGQSYYNVLVIGLDECHQINVDYTFCELK